MTLDLQHPFDPVFLARLEKLHLCSRRVFSGRINAKHVSKKLGTGTEFADHRSYAPGDDLRLLDWNIYARTEKLYTNLFRQEEDRNIFMLLDCSLSMAVEKEKWDFSRKLAAALAYIGLYDMDRIFLLGFGQGITNTRPVLRGRRGVMQALKFLGSLDASGGTDFLHTARDFSSMHGQKQGMVIFISDFLDTEGLPAALDRFFSMGFEVLAIQVLTPFELDPKLLGEWKLANPEGTKPYTAHLTRRTLARYRNEIAAHGNMLRRHILAHRGAYIRAITSTHLEDLILKELRAGNLLA